MTQHQALQYELHASPWVKHLSHPLLQELAGKYFAWKVRRKWARYSESQRVRAELIAAGIPLKP